MENDHAVISLKAYNRLRDFQTKIAGGEILALYDWDRSEEFLYISKDEATKRLIDEKFDLKKEIALLQHKIYNLKNPPSKVLTLKDVKKMSILKFIKWRRK